MQTSELDRALERALEGYRLLDHPFYRRWEAGTLGRPELAAYAAQYRHFEAALPDLLERLAQLVADGPARQAVLANLADELGDPVPHLELFGAFADAVGARPQPPSEATGRLTEAYAAVLGGGAVSGLAGLLAYECQAPEIAASKGEGLRCHYGVSPGGTAFWDHHATVEVAHARWGVEALAALDPDPAAVTEAAAMVARAWWAFLDEREACAAA